MSPHLRWGDAVVLALAVAVVAAAFLGTYRSPAESSRQLVVQQAGQPMRVFDLDSPQRIEIEGVAGITVIEIAEGRARCRESPGDQHLCERAGWLERPGDIAISLPNRLLLRIDGASLPFDSIHF